MEKSREERFQSARDLAFHLQQLPGVSARMSGAVAQARWRRRWGSRDAITALLGAAAAVLGLLAWQATHRPSRATFQQLTFKHGRIASARFAPDAQTIVYSEARAGESQRCSG